MPSKSSRHEHAARGHPGAAGAPASVREHVTPSTPTERLLCEVLTDIVHAERVSVESNFFDDLGADSMVMAHFCARVRKRGICPRCP